ncbi:MAG: hypothetical protein IJR91_01230 [Ruminococcus sp.]|nr:hypothetical protein [Ruminococcus sp.]
MRVALCRNGAEYFKELYMDALRKTPLYKKLTEAKTADERAGDLILELLQRWSFPSRT